jgi:hypothetical protein
MYVCIYIYIYIERERERERERELVRNETPKRGGGSVPHFRISHIRLPLAHGSCNFMVASAEHAERVEALTPA